MSSSPPQSPVKSPEVPCPYLLLDLPSGILVKYILPHLDLPSLIALSGTSKDLRLMINHPSMSRREESSIWSSMYARFEPIGLLRKDLGLTCRLAAPWRCRVTGAASSSSSSSPHNNNNSNRNHKSHNALAFARIAVATKRVVVTVDAVPDGGHVCWHHSRRAQSKEDDDEHEHDQPSSSSSSSQLDDTTVVPGTLTWDPHGSHLYYVSTARALPGASGLSLAPAYLHVVARKKFESDERERDDDNDERETAHHPKDEPSRIDLPPWARSGDRSLVNIGQRSVRRAVSRLVHHFTSNVASATSGLVRPFGALVGALAQPQGGAWTAREKADAITTTAMSASVLAHQSNPCPTPNYHRSVTALLPIGRVPFYLSPSACGTLLGYLAPSPAGSGGTLSMYVADVAELTMPSWMRAFDAIDDEHAHDDDNSKINSNNDGKDASKVAEVAGRSIAEGRTAHAMHRMEHAPGMRIVGSALAERRTPLISGAPLYFSWSPVGQNVLAIRYGAETVTAPAQMDDTKPILRTLHTLGVAQAGAITSLQWVRGDSSSTSMGYALVCLTSAGGARVYLCRGEAIAHGRLDGAFDRAAVATATTRGSGGRHEHLEPAAETTEEQTSTIWERLCPIFDVARQIDAPGPRAPADVEADNGSIVRRVYALSASPDARYVAWASAEGVHVCRTPYSGGAMPSIQERSSQPLGLHDFESDAQNRVRRGLLPTHLVLNLPLERVVAMQWSPVGKRLLVLAMHVGGNRDTQMDDSPTSAFGFFRWHVLDFSDTDEDGNAIVPTSMVPTTAQLLRVARFAPFYPSEEFARSVLPFFDQYQQSHSLWDPTGTRFCYCGYHFMNRRDAGRVAATSQGAGAVFVHPAVSACFVYAQTIPSCGTPNSYADNFWGVAPQPNEPWVQHAASNENAIGSRLLECGVHAPAVTVFEGEVAWWCCPRRSASSL